MRIGIGVTSHNRHSVTAQTLDHIRRHTRIPFKLVVVDDASDSEPPFPVDHRFPNNVGIARAKNKCLELLDDCDHVFLFDDDTFPTDITWWLPYINSPEAHLMYVFQDFLDGTKLHDTARVYEDNQHVAYSHARGCMLYFTRSALEAVGGFDPAFGKWGWEHINLSDRIYAARLTTFPYMDVVGSNKLIFSGDEHRSIPTTMPNSKRPKLLARNRKVYDERHGQPYYVDYREYDPLMDVVLACYFVGMNDPQRGEAWVAHPDELTALSASVGTVGPNANLVILNNCSLPGGKTVAVGNNVSPYWQRWVSLYQWLVAHPAVGNVWCVDATDVEMLRNPFNDMEPGVLYVGDEQNATLGIPWMFNQHPSRKLQQFFRANAQHRLFNCGILGGSRDTVLEFIGKMLWAYGKNREDVAFGRDLSVGETDMGLFNLIVHSMLHRVEHGPKVNTVFKKFQDNGQAWWRHK